MNNVDEFTFKKFVDFFLFLTYYFKFFFEPFYIA
jgi:hypothetical protein